MNFFAGDGEPLLEMPFTCRVEIAQILRLDGVVFIRIVKVTMAADKHVWIAAGYRGHKLGHFIMLKVHHCLVYLWHDCHGQSHA